nr:Histone H1 H5 domain containing protein [Haemonchus contortus]
MSGGRTQFYSATDMSTDLAVMPTDTPTDLATRPKDSRRQPRAHPPYTKMVQKAIAELNEKSGSSKSAIVRYLIQNYQLGDNVSKINTNIRRALKKGVEKGELKQVTGNGAVGSFTLGVKKAAAPRVRKPVAKKAIKRDPTPAPAKKEKAAPQEKKEKRVTFKKTPAAPKEKREGAVAPKAKKPRNGTLSKAKAATSKSTEKEGTAKQTNSKKSVRSTRKTPSEISH